MIVGAEASLDLASLPGSVANRRLIVTKKNVRGRSLDELAALADHRVVFTRVERHGLALTPRPSFRVKLGDVLTAVGDEQHIAAVAAPLGDSPKVLDAPQPIPLFLGIVLGVIVGSIPLGIPDEPGVLRKGLAGGPLLVAIALSRLGNTGPIVWYVQPTASDAARARHHALPRGGRHQLGGVLR